MFREHMDEQTRALAAVSDRATLAAWHRRFAGAWGRDADGLAEASTDWLGLEPTAGAGGAPWDPRLKPEVGYLAVETAAALRPGAARWLVLGTNPGWSTLVNPTERRLKGHGPTGVGIGPYERFRAAFFPRYFEHVCMPNGVEPSWWTRMRGFVAQARPAGAGSDVDLTGWNLWPWHSQNDGLSARATLPQSDGDHELRRFARASIDAAARFAAREDATMLVVSSAVFALLSTLADSDDTVRLARRGDLHPEGVTPVPCGKFTHVATGRPVFAVGWPLFGRDVPENVLDRAVAFVRDEPDGLGTVR